MRKNYFNLQLILSALFIAVMASCSMRTVNIHTMRPADINVPSHIDTLLMVNRSQFDKQAVNIIEGILTGEMPGEDKAGTQEAMNSFQMGLAQSNRFVVKNATEILAGNSISAAFPNPLDWGTVEQLCQKYGTNAVVAIEIFDTDFIVTDGTRKVKKEVTENGVKKTIETDEFYAQGVGNITIGFRVYDPKTKTVVDQNLMTHSNTWETTGKTVRDALAQLVIKSEATRYMSRIAGDAYAHKISPMPITLHRDYYAKSKKTPLLVAGARSAEVNDWNAALTTWQQALPNARTTKDKGRICYNIAIAYEVLGDFYNAKQWANKGYVEYGNKKARSYAAMLDYRANDELRLRQQMDE